MPRDPVQVTTNPGEQDDDSAQLARVERQALELEERLARLAGALPPPSTQYHFLETIDGGCVSVAVTGARIPVFPYRRHLAIECRQTGEHPHRGQHYSADLVLKPQSFDPGPGQLPLCEQNTPTVEALVNRLAGYLFGQYPQHAVCAIFVDGCWRIIVYDYYSDDREAIFTVVDAPDVACSYNRMGLDIDHRGQGVPVTAIYKLSEAGQKANLLAGGTGRQIQQVTGEIPIADLAYTRVNNAGQILLFVGEFRVPVNDTKTRDVVRRTYGRVPSELNRWYEGYMVGTFDTPMTPVRLLNWVKAVEADRDRCRAEALAELQAMPLEQLYAETLDDAGQYLPEHRYASLLGTAQGYVHLSYSFPRATQVIAAFPFVKLIAEERRRRLQAGKEAEKESGVEFISAFVRQHGTPQQIEQLEAGTLSRFDSDQLLRDVTLAPLAEEHFPTYCKVNLRALRAMCHDDCACKVALALGTTCNISCSTADAKSTEAEQQMIVRILERLPEATVQVKERSCTCDDSACATQNFSHRRLEVTVTVGPRKFTHALNSPSNSFEQESTRAPGVEPGCKWCAEGYTPIRSSVSEKFVHPDTLVGRKVCGLSDDYASGRRS